MASQTWNPNPLGLTPMSCDDLNGLFRVWDGHLDELIAAGCRDMAVLSHGCVHEFRRHRRAQAQFSLRALGRVSRSASAVAGAVEAQLLRVLG